ncbi:hypothetical protein EYF80_007514 [Liparis tanakae]|uniref:Uncharacterized protein n=1 Tax=Liparis tanakae TaxID=230148 RepID=A0A4Z2IW84_9TELE|nr:hypothetical protein EYF80_007514 [Liparis tanakae]
MEGLSSSPLANFNTSYLVTSCNSDAAGIMWTLSAFCPSRQRDRTRFLDVGFLVGRVLILVFCLLVRAVFLSLDQCHGLEHYPQTLKQRTYSQNSTTALVLGLSFGVVGASFTVSVKTSPSDALVPLVAMVTVSVG